MTFEDEWIARALTAAPLEFHPTKKTPPDEVLSTFFFTVQSTLLPLIAFAGGGGGGDGGDGGGDGGGGGGEGGGGGGDGGGGGGGGDGGGDGGGGDGGGDGGGEGVGTIQRMSASLSVTFCEITTIRTNKGLCALSAYATGTMS